MLNLPRLAFKSRVLTGCSGSVLHQPNFEARRDLRKSQSTVSTFKGKKIVPRLFQQRSIGGQETAS